MHVDDAIGHDDVPQLQLFAKRARESGRHNPVGPVELDHVVGRALRRLTPHTRFDHRYVATVEIAHVLDKRGAPRADPIVQQINQPPGFHSQGKDEHHVAPPGRHWSRILADRLCGGIRATRRTFYLAAVVSTLAIAAIAALLSGTRHGIHHSPLGRMANVLADKHSKPHGKRPERRRANRKEPSGTGSVCGVCGAKCACPLLRRRISPYRAALRLTT